MGREPANTKPGAAAATREGGREAVLQSVPKHAVCAEIGTWKGDFAARILAITKPKELNLIDPWRFAGEFPGRWYGGKIAQDQAGMDAICEGVKARFKAHPEVKIHRQPSRTGHTAFADRYFDWIYIDGDHSYEAVLADLTGWLPKVKPGGMILCDDYNWKDESGKRSVKAAVDDFIAARAAQGFASTHMGAGQVIIAVPDQPAP